eukprot:6706070-Pyramimonas_sp.AAC.1
MLPNSADRTKIARLSRNPRPAKADHGTTSGRHAVTSPVAGWLARVAACRQTRPARGPALATAPCTHGAHARIAASARGMLEATTPG